MRVDQNLEQGDPKENKQKIMSVLLKLNTYCTGQVWKEIVADTWHMNVEKQFVFSSRFD